MKLRFVIFFTSSLLVDSNNKYRDVNIVIYVTEFALTCIVDNVMYLKVNISDKILDVMNTKINPFFPNIFLKKYRDNIHIIRIQR